MNREEKKDLVASMNALFTETGLVIVTQYKGLTVKQVNDLRDQMRSEGASFKVTKNRLTRLALKGTKYEGLSDMFTGPTAIAYSDDPVAAARVSVKFAKGNDKLMIMGGGLGNQVLDEGGIRALAALPSLDELRAKLVGMINTPATRIAGVLQAPAGQVARVIGAYSKKDEAA